MRYHHLRIVSRVLVVLVGNLGEVFRLCAILGHMLLASIPKELCSDRATIHTCQLSHHLYMLVHGICAIKILEKKNKELIMRHITIKDAIKNEAKVPLSLEIHAPSFQNQEPKHIHQCQLLQFVLQEVERLSLLSNCC